jgi:hypothetical protein
MNTQTKVENAGSGEPVSAIKSSYLLLLAYAALFGAGAALLTVVYITVYNWGVNFFK